uniref:Poly [ADP-ribose] polymerase n=1 Tax=Syphacia muris TaxID=451379 RepID=A0A0N5ART2_9BILA
MCSKRNAENQPTKSAADDVDMADASSSVELDLKIRWEYEAGRNKWIQYGEDLSNKINALTTETPSTEIILNESKLKIDILLMKQKNLTTGFLRSIRCACCDGKGFFIWEYLNKRRWQGFDRSSTVMLEEAFRSGTGNVTLQFLGEKCLVDFDTKLISGTDTDVQYKIRRELSAAEGAQSGDPAPPVDKIRNLKRKSAKEIAKPEDDEVAREAEQSADGSSFPKKRTINTRSTDKHDDSITVQKTNEERSDDKVDLRKVVVKGAVAVDPECDISSSSHVYVEGKIPYDALLNQTNAQNNNNKYYIIQLLEDDKQKRYFVWFRWGRVGYKGQRDLVACGNDIDKAKSLFCRKFSDKTHNEWSNIKKFKKVVGKYDYIKADYATQKQPKSKEKQVSVAESKLDISVQNLMKLICNLQIMEQNVMEMEYDASKSPLGRGKLTKKQIKSGYALLKKIENFITKKDYSEAFVNAVNNYYTKIPHSFGMRQPPLIKTTKQLKTELELLEMLDNIEIGIRAIMEEKENDSVNPIDSQYFSMKCDLTAVDISDPQYKLVEKYLQNTHAATHRNYRMKIKQMFSVNRQEEAAGFLGHLGNKKLLWHGSRITNWYGILSQGLRIAPPEAPVTGYMFGKGIYFADMSSKSANYCFPQKGKAGIILLAEVALGKQRLLVSSNCNAHELSDGNDSTMGLGRIGPNPSMDEMIDGVTVPCGTPIDLKRENCTLNYNEYVVYNTKQAKIRYAIILDFIFGPLM